MPTIDYLKWRLKVIKNSVSFRKLWNDIKDFPKDFSFKLRHGIDRWEWWGPNTSIATHALKTLWGMRNPQGYPVKLMKDEEWGEDLSDDVDKEYSKRWKDIIHSIRFAFFYYNFIDEEPFSWMIDSPEDREYCCAWAVKKYWYAADFLTKEFFEQMYPDSIFRYKSKMVTLPSEDGLTQQITFKTIDKSTGEEVHIPHNEQYPHHAIAEQLRPDFDKGLQLFKDYFLSLWD